MQEMPITALKSGLRLGNFSSPHTFTFSDGTVLEACNAERCKAWPLNVTETEVASEDDRYTNLLVQHLMTAELWKELERVHELDVDIIIVPRVLLEAVARCEGNIVLSQRRFPKLRTIRLKDRVNKINYSDRFCC